MLVTGRGPRRGVVLALAAVALLVAGVLLVVLRMAPWLIGVGVATDEDIRAVSWRLAMRLPRTIDGETRLERVEAGQGREQILHFRLVKQDASALAGSGVFARMQARARTRICDEPALAPLVTRGVKTTYVYHDRSGREAARFSVRPLDCLLRRLGPMLGIGSDA